MRYIFIFIVSIFLISCKKDDDFSTRQYIRIINLTEFQFDTIRITSAEPCHAALPDVFFTSVKIDSTSQYLEVINFYRDLRFTFIFNESEIKTDWHLPKYVIDPAGQSYCNAPSGKYTYTLIKFDTLSNEMLIGLTDYE